ncbi:hypothetical protein FH972_015088 [Carpinus fangiana]|uniref:Uncharacterized protein n=1 Tax=Carpinus fangiana TaxID=176857 RepID=A0A5N6RDH7_9ROSI|nr:hypothetical protein FH972_015088 [Carpinus fangiana]
MAVFLRLSMAEPHSASTRRASLRLSMAKHCSTLAWPRALLCLSMTKPHSTSARRASLRLYMVENLACLSMVELHSTLEWLSLTPTWQALLRLSMAKPHSTSARQASLYLCMAKSLAPPQHDRASLCLIVAEPHSAFPRPSFT